MSSKRFFYGFQFLDGRGTTWGNSPNKRTGKYDIAGHPVAFLSKEERDNWASKNIKRASVTRRELRRLKRGHTIAEFNDLLSVIQYESGE